MKVDQLVQDKRNANKGTKRGRQLVAESFKRFGAARSVVTDRNDVLIAGNKSAAGAAEAGITDVITVETDGTKLIVVKRIDLDINDQKAQALAIADNRTSEIGLEWNPDVLAELVGVGDMDLRPFFTEDELADTLKLGEEGEGGELLSRMDITVDEPKHTVEKCDVWKLGRHILVCESVIEGWPTWSPLLTDGALFAPFPGPFVLMSEKAKTHAMVLVQPDTYIAGHIIDRYAEVFGADGIVKEKQ